MCGRCTLACLLAFVCMRCGALPPLLSPYQTSLTSGAQRLEGGAMPLSLKERPVSRMWHLTGHLWPEHCGLRTPSLNTHGLAVLPSSQLSLLVQGIRRGCGGGSRGATHILPTRTATIWWGGGGRL